MKLYTLLVGRSKNNGCRCDANPPGARLVLGRTPTIPDISALRIFTVAGNKGRCGKSSLLLAAILAGCRSLNVNILPTNARKNTLKK